MRGTLGLSASCRVLRGIIPAYAGNTGLDTLVDTFSGDHPRVCGEHQERNTLKHEYTGSSPRMRGTQTTKHRRTHHTRIIPAYAGNTVDEDLRGFGAGDHPRVCGEHLVFAAVALSTVGSSPRMRGTRRRRSDRPGQTGIIPAYAGNTLSWTLWHPS